MRVAMAEQHKPRCVSRWRVGYDGCASWLKKAKQAIKISLNLLGVHSGFTQAYLVPESKRDVMKHSCFKSGHSTLPMQHHVVQL